MKKLKTLPTTRSHDPTTATTPAHVAISKMTPATLGQAKYIEPLSDHKGGVGMSTIGVGVGTAITVTG